MNAMPTKGTRSNRVKRIPLGASRAAKTASNDKLATAGEGSGERTEPMNMMSKIEAAPIILDERDLPPHVATADEPIEDMGERPWDGPDVRDARSIEQMLHDLRTLDYDELGYLQHWLVQLKSIGGSASACYERDGSLHLMVGMPCDQQMRHRSRWSYFLAKDLRRLEGRGDAMLKLLVMLGRYDDQRPAGIRETMNALRDFLAAGFRVFITPEGKIDESGSMPREWVDAERSRQMEIERAGRAFTRLRHRPCAQKYVRRAIRMLGDRREASGFIVLTRRNEKSDVA
jgi:hypothetical protein